MLPAPLLLAPARPQHRQPAVRDEIAQVMGVLARAGAVGLPRRRGAVPDRADRPARRRDRRPARAAARPARVPQPPQRRGGAARRGQPAGRGRSARSSATRTATSCTCCFDFLGNQALYLSLARGEAAPLARALRDDAGDRRTTRALGRFVRNHDELTLDKLTDDERAGGLRALRARRRTCSSTAAGCAAACRRCSTATSARSGWSTRSPSRCPARRCCSTARRSAWARTSRSRAATACASPMQWSAERERRLLDGRRRRRRCAARSPTARTGPSTSTSPRSAATPTRC